MRIGVQLGYGGVRGLTRGHAEPLHGATIRIRRLEDVGADIVWVAEAYGFDAPSQMGYLAAITEYVQIGSGIMPVHTRSPALLARTAAGLDALSGGRAILGLGVSGPQVIEGWHGVPFETPIRRTRECIDTCRRVWRGEVVQAEDVQAEDVQAEDVQGEDTTSNPEQLVHASWPGGSRTPVAHIRDRIPIYVAALGDRNVELTAELAEGWLPAIFLPERASRAWGSALRSGRSRRHPSLGSLEIAAGGLFAVGEGLERLRDSARRDLARTLGGMGARTRNFYNELVARYGFEREAKLVQDLYLAGRRDEAANALPEELVEGTSLIGPESHLRERIAAFAEAGVSILNITPVGTDPVRDVELLRGWC